MQRVFNDHLFDNIGRPMGGPNTSLPPPKTPLSPEASRLAMRRVIPPSQLRKVWYVDGTFHDPLCRPVSPVSSLSTDDDISAEEYDIFAEDYDYYNEDELEGSQVDETMLQDCKLDLALPYSTEEFELGKPMELPKLSENPASPKLANSASDNSEEVDEEAYDSDEWWEVQTNSEVSKPAEATQRPDEVDLDFREDENGYTHVPYSSSGEDLAELSETLKLL